MSMVFVLLITTWLVTTATGTTLAPNFNRPNMSVSDAIWKYGFYYVSVDQTVNITCTVTSPAYNVSRLVIYLRKTVMTDITQVDNVSKQVSVTATKPGQYFYRCCVDQCPSVVWYDKHVNAVTLKFEYQTLVVANLACFSPDYKYMYCSWLVPNTTDQLVWNMTYCIEGYLPKELFDHSCRSRDNATDSYEPYKTMCESLPTASISSNTDRTVYSCEIEHFYKTQTYRINVTGAGDFSRATGGGRVRAGVNIVQYSPVKNLQLAGPPSSTNLSLHWSEPTFISGAHPQYRLVVRRLATTGTKYVGTYNTNRTRYTMVGLTPGSSYNIQIEAKPEQSPYWSNPKSITVTTNETGISTTPDKQNIGAIAGVSAALSVIVIICISCIIYHRRRLCSLDKFPILTPKMIHTEADIPPTASSEQFGYQSLPDSRIHSHIDQPVIADSVSDITEHCSGSSQDSRSDANVNSDVLPSVSMIRNQHVTSPSIASKSTSVSTPRLSAASSYVIVDSTTNQGAISRQEVHSDYIPNHGNYISRDAGACKEGNVSSPVSQGGADSVAAQSGKEVHVANTPNQEAYAGLNAYSMKEVQRGIAASKENTSNRAIHDLQKDYVSKTNSNVNAFLHSDYIRWNSKKN